MIMEKETATSPLIKDGKILTRRFLGNLFPKNTPESNELKAYTKGHQEYTYGRQLVKTQAGVYMVVPMQHDVRQEYFYQ